MSQDIYPYRVREKIYDNPLSAEADVQGFQLEGQAKISFPRGRMRLASTRDPVEGQRSHFVLWCPQDFPDNIAISWYAWPLEEPGLCMLFFAATGRNGEDIFDPGLSRRTGEYDQYRYGDINALHASYFRRKLPQERAFHTCNLRKSHGFHLVTRGGDPIPDADEISGPYRILVVKYGAEVALWIDDLQIFSWRDDGEKYGPVLGAGKIGFRQMAPLVAEYEDLQVHRVERQD